MFIAALNRKLGYIGKSVSKINTFAVRASQYDHKADIYKKKRLSDRWHVFSDGSRVQRDMYSAFLIQNTTEGLDSADREKCLSSYPEFKALHDAELAKLNSDCSSTLLWYIS